MNFQDNVEYIFWHIYLSLLVKNDLSTKYYQLGDMTDEIYSCNPFVESVTIFKYTDKIILGREIKGVFTVNTTYLLIN